MALRSRHALSAGALLALGVLASACDQASAESKPEAPIANASQPGAAPGSLQPSAAATPTPSTTTPRATYQEEAFELSLTGPTTGKVDETLEFVVLLHAKAGYKVNPEYPIKFAFEASEGLVPEVAVLKKEQGTVEKSKAELRGKLKIQKTGAHAVAGKLSFSVCTDERCLIEKRDLGLVLNAS